jgi:hypothetical protein
MLVLWLSIMFANFDTYFQPLLEDLILLWRGVFSYDVL